MPGNEISKRPARLSRNAKSSITPVTEKNVTDGKGNLVHASNKKPQTNLERNEAKNPTQSDAQSKKPQIDGVGNKHQTIEKVNRSNLKNVSGSRYVELSKMCNKCDKPCGLNQGNENAQCNKCQSWFHSECTSINKKELEEQLLLGIYECDECLALTNQNDGASSVGLSETESMESENCDTMNSEEMRKAQFDEIMEEEIMEEPMVQNELKNDFNKPNHMLNEGPRTSSPKAKAETRELVDQEGGPDSRNLNAKLDMMLGRMDDLKTEVQKVKSEMKKSEFEFETFSKKLNVQVKANVQQTVNEVFARRENNLLEKTDKYIETKVNEGITREIEKNLDWKIDEQLRDMNEKIDRNINNIEQRVEQNIEKELDSKIESRIQEKLDSKLKSFRESMDLSLDKRIESKFNQNLDQKLKTMETRVNESVTKKVEQDLNRKSEHFVTNSKLEDAMDEVSEKIWRKKNIIVVNIPESTKKAILDRKMEDLETVLPLLNKIMTVERSDIDGLPIRVGLVGDRPRLLRVSLKSEIQARELVNRARETNDILNPTEKDKKKKIYINRDFTLQDRENRKEARKAKKELESQGIKAEVRGGKVIILEQEDFIAAYPSSMEVGEIFRNPNDCQKFQLTEQMHGPHPGSQINSTCMAPNLSNLHASYSSVVDDEQTGRSPMNRPELSGRPESKDQVPQRNHDHKQPDQSKGNVQGLQSQSYYSGPMGYDQRRGNYNYGPPQNYYEYDRHNGRHASYGPPRHMYRGQSRGRGSSYDRRPYNNRR